MSRADSNINISPDVDLSKASIMQWSTLPATAFAIQSGILADFSSSVF